MPLAYKFCFCGRTVEINSQTCKKHRGKVSRVKVTKVGKYSGYSKAFEQNHGAEKADD